MSNRAKSASRNGTEKSRSKSSADFERRVAELAADIHLQMGTKMCTEEGNPGVGRKQEGGNQAGAQREREQDEKSDRAARVISNEYKEYKRVKSRQQLLLLIFQHSFELSFKKIAEVKDAATLEFGKQNYRQAMHKYQKAEDLCDSAQKMMTLHEECEVGFSQGDIDMLQNVRKLQVLCWLNRSLCHFLLEEYEESFVCCTHVFRNQFSDQKSKIKALLRAGHSLCTLATQDDKNMKNLLQTAVLCTAIAKQTIDADPVNYFEFKEAMKPLQRQISDLQSKIETKMK